MTKTLEHVVILGAGTMGSRLAAHCANHGLATTVLDLSREQARTGLETAAKSRPASFFLPDLAGNIQTGSFSDDGGSLGAADWVIEAITEDLEAKRALLAEVAPRLNPAAVLSTNTSGLPIHAVGAGLSHGLKRRWLGTHFFNPPRYMQLVEVIPGPETDTALVGWLGEQLARRLGKGVVGARDTPNFIANRIGLFTLMNTLHLMHEYKLSVEEVDALTGPLLGWPKSATFRTLDLIGLDTLAQVICNSREHLRGDERRDLYQIPKFLQVMIERCWLGEKSGQGFYRKSGDEIWALDLETMTYHPRRKVSVPFQGTADAVKGSTFLNQCMQELFEYAERRVGEITNEPGDMDRAMRWGYNWQYGPFELRKLIDTGKPPERRLGPTVRHNGGCSLLDLGAGVGCLEFHTKLNVIGGDTVEMVTAALSERDSPFEAFVISNGAENFSAGANLVYLLATIQNEDWDEVEEAVRRFQAMTQAVRRSPRPVVVAPFGLTLGGGCELMLHAARVVAHAELYAGLVEAGVGLIPAGGGTKAMALRCSARQAFETVARARVSTSAAEARQMRLLRDGDEVVANRDRVLTAAREEARQLADAGYEAPVAAELIAPGPSVEGTLRLSAYLMREAGRISDHDRKIADHLAHVICAGGAPAGMAVSEVRILDLEREAFLSLCGEPKTQERIAFMLKTGKPLRN